MVASRMKLEIDLQVFFLPCQVEAGKLGGSAFQILLPKHSTSLFNNFLISTLKKELGEEEVI